MIAVIFVDILVLRMVFCRDLVRILNIPVPLPDVD